MFAQQSLHAFWGGGVRHYIIPQQSSINGTYSMHTYKAYCTHIYANMHSHTSASMKVHAPINILNHTHAHIHTHIHTHASTHPPLPNPHTHLVRRVIRVCQVLCQLVGGEHDLIQQAMHPTCMQRPQCAQFAASSLVGAALQCASVGQLVG